MKQGITHDPFSGQGDCRDPSELPGCCHRPVDPEALEERIELVELLEKKKGGLWEEYRRALQDGTLKASE